MATTVTGERTTTKALNAVCYVHHIIRGKYTELTLNDTGNVEFTVHADDFDAVTTVLNAQTHPVRDRYDADGGLTRTWDAHVDINGVKVGLTAYDYDPPAGGTR